RDALVRGVDGPHRVGRREHRQVIPVAVLLDEVGDRTAHRAGDLQQGGDRRNHPALLDLVNRRGGDIGAVSELLQRQADALADDERRQRDGADDALEVVRGVLAVRRRLWIEARRALGTRESVHGGPVPSGRIILTCMDAPASIVYEASRILNGRFPYSYEEG